MKFVKHKRILPRRMVSERFSILKASKKAQLEVRKILIFFTIRFFLSTLK